MEDRTDSVLNAIFSNYFLGWYNDRNTNEEIGAKRGFLISPQQWQLEGRGQPNKKPDFAVEFFDESLNENGQTGVPFLHVLVEDKRFDKINYHKSLKGGTRTTYFFNKTRRITTGCQRWYGTSSYSGLCSKDSFFYNPSMT